VSEIIWVVLHNVYDFTGLCFCEGIVGKVGEHRDAVVLHVDPVANCVQLTFNKNVITAVQNFKDNKFTQVWVNVIVINYNISFLSMA